MPETIKPWLTKSQSENLTRNEISEGEKEYFSPMDIEDEEGSEKFYPELIPTEELLTSANSRDDIYFSYANAISRRGREPLSQGRFEAHFFDGASFDRPLAYYLES